MLKKYEIIGIILYCIWSYLISLLFDDIILYNSTNLYNIYIKYILIIIMVVVFVLSGYIFWINEKDD